MISKADILIVVIVAILAIGSALKKIKENERIAIYRFGKLIRIDGPGIIMTVPMIDKTKILKLDVTLPHWRGMSSRDIQEQLRHEVLKA